MNSEFYKKAFSGVTPRQNAVKRLYEIAESGPARRRSVWRKTLAVLAAALASFASLTGVFSATTAEDVAQQKAKTPGTREEGEIKLEGAYLYIPREACTEVRAIKDGNFVVIISAPEIEVGGIPQEELQILVSEILISHEEDLVIVNDVQYGCDRSGPAVTVKYQDNGEPIYRPCQSN